MKGLDHDKHWLQVLTFEGWIFVSRYDDERLASKYEFPMDVAMWELEEDQNIISAVPVVVLGNDKMQIGVR